MKIFVSWSGDRSKAVAQALERFLPDVVDGVKIWFSDQDISPGSRWNSELSKELQNNSFGIICLTPENLDSRWVLFEAGALSKSMANSRVIPYRLGLDPADIPPPIGQFQGLNADKDGTWSLVSSLHEASKESADTDRIERRFKKFWPDFEAQIAEIPTPKEKKSSHRPDRELLEELLEIVRDLKTDRARIEREEPVASKIKTRMNDVLYRQRVLGNTFDQAQMRLIEERIDRAKLLMEMEDYKTADELIRKIESKI